MAQLPEIAQMLNQEIYATLRKEILTWQLTPGMNLQEVQLAQRFGVSRTPVREALRKLASEGLVTLVPQRGASVSEVSIRDVLEAYQIRELLEPAACGIAASRITDEELDSMERVLAYEPKERPTREDLAAYHKADHLVHDGIIAACGNQLLASIVKELRARTIRVQFLVPPGRSRDSRGEHRKILQTLRQRDSQAAIAAMREHLLKAKARLAF